MLLLAHITEQLNPSSYMTPLYSKYSIGLLLITQKHAELLSIQCSQELGPGKLQDNL
jgi:hypothetical protein